MIKFCINLPERPEKWEAAQTEFKKLRGDVLKWTATKMTPGYDGCRTSHLELLKHARFEYPNENLMVFEDDALFCVDNPQDLIEQSMRELPKDWDMLYLGATLTEPVQKYSEHLYRITKAWTTHAMIFNHKSKVIDFILENNGGGRKIDVFYADVVQNQFKCFITYPMIATQRNGYSDILNKNVPNGDIIRDYYNRFIKK